MTRFAKESGFTLAELLIVVTIIGVLVAIGVSVYSGLLERSKEATDIANIRAAYAEACAEALSSGDGTGRAETVPMSQSQQGWEYISPIIGENYFLSDDGTEDGVKLEPVSGDIVIVSVAEDVTITFKGKQ